jgi:hypothetical protein
MIIIGVDFHPGFQQIASLDSDTGEFQEKRLLHLQEAEKFYRALATAAQKVRVGMEASGQARWFERLLAELQIELWIGDAARIQSKRGRKQKTDRQDAQHILKLMLKDDFPRIWVPSWENRDLRQLLWHRHRMVQARTRIMNQLQAGTGIVRLGSLGEPAPARFAGVARSAEPDARGVKSGDRSGSREVFRGQAPHDASRSRSTDRTGFRIDRRQRGALSVWEADCQLSRTGATRKVQRKSAALGSHHQTREFAGALSAGGSGPGHGAQLAGMA